MVPDDIDPESGCRLKLPLREALDEEGRILYDRLIDPAGGSIRGVRGPGGIQLHNPRLARHTGPVNRYLRQEAGLSGRVRELAILTTARECDSQFEWAAHEPEARREGIPQEIIEIVRHRGGTAGLDEADSVLIELGRAIFGARKVASPLYARAVALWGERMLIDIVALMGNYAATAALLATFDMQLDPGQDPPLPLP